MTIDVQMTDMNMAYIQKPAILYFDNVIKQKKDAGEVLTILADRLTLSYQNEDKFFDENWKDYYVWYSQKRMAQFLHCGERKIYSIYSFLEKEDYIRRETIGLTKPDKIFLSKAAKSLFPKLIQLLKLRPAKIAVPDSQKNASQDSQKMQTIHSNKNHSDINQCESSINSVNSRKNNNPNIKQDNKNQNSIIEKTKKDVNNLDQLKSTRLINWVTKTRYGLGLSTNVLINILKVTHNNINEAKRIIKIIKNARSHITKKYNISFQDKRARFEYNDNLDLPLADKILYIFNYVNKKELKENERNKYIMGCFIDFFFDALGLKIKETNFTTRPDMTDDDDNSLLNDNLLDNDNKYKNDQISPLDKLAASNGGHFPKMTDLR